MGPQRVRNPADQVLMLGSGISRYGQKRVAHSRRRRRGLQANGPTASLRAGTPKSSLPSPSHPFTFLLSHFNIPPCVTPPSPPPLTASTAPVSASTWRKVALRCSTATTSCPPART